MNSSMLAIMRKDLRGVTVNRRLFSSLWILPVIFTVFLPSVFNFIFYVSPEDSDFTKMIDLLPASMQTGDLTQIMADLALNNIMPVFLLIIPVMTSSIMAASSFVGEKEKHTLETLLYSPLSLKQIFQAKVLASFSLSMLVTFVSCILLFVVFGIENYILSGWIPMPSLTWLVLLFLLSPSISLIAVTLIAPGSAKAQSVEESQQSASYLVIPVVLLIVGQVSGILLINAGILFLLSILSAVIAWFLMQKSMKNWNYEKLLR